MLMLVIIVLQDIVLLKSGTDNKVVHDKVRDTTQELYDLHNIQLGRKSLSHVNVAYP